MAYKNNNLIMFRKGRSRKKANAIIKSEKL